ncbi:hypothetical protein ACET97_04570 [Aeromonas enteropelogenes]|uniref:hypothetical protein n=1 Tax=Aeromonas enteropelogenes TaxID=29489 RepID=UPI0038D1C0F5
MSKNKNRHAAKHVSERDNIILKAVIHELALELDTELIPTAHALGTNRHALRLSQELLARKEDAIAK